MARKKSKKLDFSNMDTLSQNPFASLGDTFGITPSSDAEKPGTTPDAAPTKKASLNIRLEKRKKGKVVTAIYNLGNEGPSLLKKLKSKLGTGGTANNELVEVQGDHREKAGAFFEAEGYKVRVS